MRFVFNDGGRQAAGYRGMAGDCVTRAIAIATNLPYQSVYEAISLAAKAERPGRKRRSSARNGVHKLTTRRVLEAMGWHRTATMHIGTGCRVHLHPDELPLGRLIVVLSKHYTAVIDGVIHDTHNPDRGGNRCVYAYWSKPQTV